MHNKYANYVIIIDVCKIISRIVTMTIAEKNYTLLTVN